MIRIQAFPLSSTWRAATGVWHSVRKQIPRRCWSLIQPTTIYEQQAIHSSLSDSALFDRLLNPSFKVCDALFYVLTTSLQRELTILIHLTKLYNGGSCGGYNKGAWSFFAWSVILALLTNIMIKQGLSPHEYDEMNVSFCTLAVVCLSRIVELFPL